MCPVPVTIVAIVNGMSTTHFPMRSAPDSAKH